jgi:hypothetical protein
MRYFLLVALLPTVALADTYLPFVTVHDADERSRQECIRRNCRANTTTFWWKVRIHPTEESALIVIGTGDGAGLTALEQTQLITKETAELFGWVFASGAP